MNDSETLRLLRSIDRRLALLTAREEQDLRIRLVTDLLRTHARIAMFDAIDGKRGSRELAEAAGVSDRAAQLFVKELLDLGLVAMGAESTGRGILVDKDHSAIVSWYLQLSSQAGTREARTG